MTVTIKTVGALGGRLLGLNWSIQREESERAMVSWIFILLYACGGVDAQHKLKLAWWEKATAKPPRTRNCAAAQCRKSLWRGNCKRGQTVAAKTEWFRQS